MIPIVPSPASCMLKMNVISSCESLPFGSGTTALLRRGTTGLLIGADGGRDSVRSLQATIPTTVTAITRMPMRVARRARDRYRVASNRPGRRPGGALLRVVIEPGECGRESADGWDYFSVYSNAVRPASGREHFSTHSVTSQEGRCDMGTLERSNPFLVAGQAIRRVRRRSARLVVVSVRRIASALLQRSHFMSPRLQTRRHSRPTTPPLHSTALGPDQDDSTARFALFVLHRDRGRTGIDLDSRELLWRRKVPKVGG